MIKTVEADFWSVEILPWNPTSQITNLRVPCLVMYGWKLLLTQVLHYSGISCRKQNWFIYFKTKQFNIGNYVLIKLMTMLQVWTLCLSLVGKNGRRQGSEGHCSHSKGLLRLKRLLIEYCNAATEKSWLCMTLVARSNNQNSRKMVSALLSHYKPHRNACN
jgi:hypothetical protein